MRTLSLKTTARITAATAAMLMVVGVHSPAASAVESSPAPSAAAPSPAVSSPSPASSSLPLCEDEDGPGPCRWDAAVQGNGVGRSYTVGADGSVRYDDGEVVAPSSASPAASASASSSASAGGQWVRSGRVSPLPAAGLPSCDSVGSWESCRGRSGEAYVVDGCGRVMVDADGVVWEPTVEAAAAMASECPATAAAGDASTTAASTAASATAGSHEDRAGLGGVRSPAASAVPDPESVPSSSSSAETVAAPSAAAAGSGLARTGLAVDHVVGLVAALGLAGWVLLGWARESGRRVGRHGASSR